MQNAGYVIYSPHKKLQWWELVSSSRGWRELAIGSWTECALCYRFKFQSPSIYLSICLSIYLSLISTYLIELTLQSTVYNTVLSDLEEIVHKMPPILFHYSAKRYIKRDDFVHLVVVHSKLFPLAVRAWWDQDSYSQDKWVLAIDSWTGCESSLY